MKTRELSYRVVHNVDNNTYVCLAYCDSLTIKTRDYTNIQDAKEAVLFEAKKHNSVLMHFVGMFSVHTGDSCWYGDYVKV